ncbi:MULTISPECIES: response regulator [unclassified Streptomyces]|uniref:response regulator n=1 Tax=unclassified Streptomyces TaxID=2593676 RepID=UPI00341EB3F1
MRILVIDDVYVIELGVARAVEGDKHVVVGVRNPEELRRRLAWDKDFQLALVDLDYGRAVQESGLAALEVLSSQNIPSVIHTVDGEDNRTLFLLAAFEFFPQTVAVLSKHSGDEPLHQIIDALKRGYSPSRALSQRYRPARGRSSLLSELVGRPEDLPVWQALARHTKLSLVAKAVNRSQRSVSDFLAKRQPVIARFQYEFMERPMPPEPSGSERNKPLLEVCGFARFHSQFFFDPDVRRLAEQCW